MKRITKGHTKRISTISSSKKKYLLGQKSRVFFNLASNRHNSKATRYSMPARNKHKAWLAVGVLLIIVVLGVVLYTIRNSEVIAGKGYLDPITSCRGYCTAPDELSCLPGSTVSGNTCPALASTGLAPICCNFDAVTPNRCVVSPGPPLWYGGETINEFIVTDQFGAGGSSGGTRMVYGSAYDEVNPRALERKADWMDSIYPPTQERGVIGKELGSFNGRARLLIPNSALDKLPGLAMPRCTQFFTRPFTISLWFNTTSSGILFGQYGQDAGQNLKGYVPVLYVGTDGKLYGEALWAGIENGNINQVVSSSVVNNGKYHHAVLTYDGNTEILYLDGKLADSESGLKIFPYACEVDDFYSYEIGNGYASTGWPYTVYSSITPYSRFPFTGQIDEFTAYASAKNKVEVNQIYQGGVKGLSQCGRACTGTTEICDGIDNDCDLIIDREAPSGMYDILGDNVCTQIISCGNYRKRCAAGQFCDSATNPLSPVCAVQVCTPNAADCVGNNQRICKPDGSGFLDEVSCNNNVCQEGACVLCTGPVPDYATFCADQTNAGSITVVNQCTSAGSCKYTCNVGYRILGNSCVADCTDVDGDNYCSEASGLTPEKSWGDCNDGDATKYHIVSGSVDADGDRYTVGEEQQICSGDSLSSGYSATSIINDCNDADARISPGAVESCNNADENCNSQIDEGIVNPVSCGLNTCTQTVVQTCTAGVLSPACVPGTPGVETCNGRDDNCNNLVDEGVSQTISCGTGVCRRTATQYCYNGAWSYASCTPGTVSPFVRETCNNLDDDCDGITDENNVCNTNTRCGDYTTVCVSGDVCSNGVCMSTSCIGTTPLNSAACPSAGAGTTVSLVLSCISGSSCQYVCATGYHISGTICLADCTDIDGDNYCAEASGTTPGKLWADCNDGNAAIKPGVMERCDGIDNNCVSGIDENNVCITNDHCGSYTTDCRTGGQVCEGGRCVNACTDTDSDNYCAEASGTTLPAGKLGWADCAPADSSKYRILTGYVDNDGDHYATGAIQSICSGVGLSSGYWATFTVNDCNDNNRNINPGAEEACNGIDDDCGGETDEYVCPTISYYCDNDLDTYFASTALSCNSYNCVPRSCRATAGTDCNDASNAIKPGVAEQCDGVDNNCDGQTDEGGVCATCSDGIRNQDEMGVDCGGTHCNVCIMKGNVYTAGNPQVINSYDLAMEALIVEANGDDDYGNLNTPPLQGSLYDIPVWVCDNGRYSLIAGGIVTCTAGFSEEANVYTTGNPQVINSFDLAMEALIVDANGDDDLGNDNTPPLQGSLYGTSVWVCDDARYSLTAFTRC